MFPLIDEIVAINNLALPLVFAFVINVVALQFELSSLGHFETKATVISSFNLGFSVVNATCILAGSGLASGIETIGGQCYGKGNLKQVGIVLQRTFVIMAVYAVPLALLYFNIEPIFLKLGQPAPVAHMAAYFCRWMILGVIPNLFSNAFQGYLACQEKTTIIMYANIVSNAISVIACWLFVYHLGYGFEAICILTPVVFWVQFLLLVSFTVLTGSHEPTWPGWSRAAFANLSEILPFALFGCAMVCAEFWLLEVMILIAGTRGPVSLGAAGVANAISFLVAVNFLAVEMSVMCRVANFLGASQPRMARQSVIAALIYIQGLALIILIPLYFLKDYVATLYTDNAGIHHEVIQTFQALVVFLYLSSVQFVWIGVTAGMGWQKWAFLMNLFCLFGVSVPLALLFLHFYPHHVVADLWWGTACGYFVVVVVAAIMLSRINWKEEAEKAYERASAESPVMADFDL